MYSKIHDHQTQILCHECGTLSSTGASCQEYIDGKEKELTQLLSRPSNRILHTLVLTIRTSVVGIVICSNEGEPL